MISLKIRGTFSARLGIRREPWTDHRQCWNLLIAIGMWFVLHVTPLWGYGAVRSKASSDTQGQIVGRAPLGIRGWMRYLRPNKRKSCRVNIKTIISAQPGMNMKIDKPLAGLFFCLFFLGSSAEDDEGEWSVEGRVILVYFEIFFNTQLGQVIVKGWGLGCGDSSTGERTIDWCLTTFSRCCILFGYSFFACGNPAYVDYVDVGASFCVV